MSTSYSDALTFETIHRPTVYSEIKEAIKATAGTLQAVQIRLNKHPAKRETLRCRLITDLKQEGFQATTQANGKGSLLVWARKL